MKSNLAKADGNIGSRFLDGLVATLEATHIVRDVAGAGFDLRISDAIFHGSRLRHF